MSLKETLKIDLELLGVSKAINDINKIRSKTTALQTAADNIKLNVKSANNDVLGSRFLNKRKYTNSETSSRINTRQLALNGSGIIPNTKIYKDFPNYISDNVKLDLPYSNKKLLGSRFLNKHEYVNPETSSRIAARQRALNGPEIIPNTKIYKDFPNYTAENLASVRTKLLRQAQEPYSDLRSFGDYASGVQSKIPYKISKKYAYNDLKDIGNYASIQTPIEKSIDPYKDLKLFNNHLSSVKPGNYKPTPSDSTYDDLRKLGGFAAQNYYKNNNTRPTFVSPSDLIQKELSKIDTATSIKQVRKYYAAANKYAVNSTRYRQTIETRAAEKIQSIREADLNNLKRTENKKSAEFEKSAKNQVASAQSYFQTGFSMHMISMYTMPFILAIRSISEEVLKTFAEFDKKYTDYAVKSQNYASVLSRQDYYGISKDTTYGLINATSVGERFAASGIDVANSQQALTSTLQVATIAEMDYKEAANGVITTLQAMHMQTDQTSEVTDAMINAANESSAELSDLVTWFEYAASAAYRMGMNVKDLSSYLGILASTGTPDAGAAMRQMLIQLSKASVQEKIKVKYSFISDADFADVNKLISKLRDYVQNSTDKKAAATEVLATIEGTANAQQSLNNLITAEPELWNRVTSAVQKSGTTQDQYNKATKNAGDILAKIATNVEILKAQFGSFFVIIAYALEKVTTALVTITTAMPASFRLIIGAILAVVGTLFILGSALIAVIGMLAIMQGTIILLKKEQFTLNVTTENFIKTLTELWMQIKQITISNYSMAGSFNSVTTSIKGTATAAITGSGAVSAWSKVISALSIGAIGYAVSSEAMSKQMYAEASAVNLLTASYLALQTAKVIPGPAGMVAAAGVWVGYENMMYNKLENAKRQDRISRLEQTHQGTTQKNYNINVANATWSTDGEMFEDFADRMQGQAVDDD